MECVPFAWLSDNKKEVFDWRNYNIMIPDPLALSGVGSWWSGAHVDDDDALLVLGWLAMRLRPCVADVAPVPLVPDLLPAVDAALEHDDCQVRG